MIHQYIFRQNFLQKWWTLEIITNDGNSDLQPDFVWVTSRSNGYNRGMFDSTRGIHKRNQF